MSDIENKNINDEVTTTDNNDSVDADVEARKKLIEEFTNRSVESKVEAEVVNPAVPDISEDDKEDMIAELEKDLMGHEEAYIPPPPKPPVDNRKSIVLLILIAIFGLFFLWFNYFEDKVFNANSIINRRPEAYKSSMKIKPKDPGFQADAMLKAPQVKKYAYGVSSRVSEFKKEQDQYRSKKTEVIKREIKKTPVVQSSVQKKVSSDSQDNYISKIWKINKVENNGQVVEVQMVDSDRIVSINVGDILMDVGRVSSISRKDGKWYVVGSKRAVSE